MQSSRDGLRQVGASQFWHPYSTSCALNFIKLFQKKVSSSREAFLTADAFSNGIRVAQRCPAGSHQRTLLKWKIRATYMNLQWSNNTVMVISRSAVIFRPFNSEGFVLFQHCVGACWDFRLLTEQPAVVESNPSWQPFALLPRKGGQGLLILCHFFQTAHIYKELKRQKTSAEEL